MGGGQGASRLGPGQADLGWLAGFSVLRTQAARLGQGSLSVEIITGWRCGLLWASLPTLSPGLTSWAAGDGAGGAAGATFQAAQ